jgi:hypothetical protein
MMTCFLGGGGGGGGGEEEEEQTICRIAEFHRHNTHTNTRLFAKVVVAVDSRFMIFDE